MKDVTMLSKLLCLLGFQSECEHDWLYSDRVYRASHCGIEWRKCLRCKLKQFRLHTYPANAKQMPWQTP